MSTNKFISSYYNRIENLNKTIQECIYKNCSDGILNLKEVHLILKGSISEIESLQKEIDELKRTNSELKNTINNEIEKLGN